MKNHPSSFHRQQGSALITVVGLVFIMAMLSASIIGYSLTEMKLNERNRLALRSENVAENISLYAAEQLTTKLQGMGSLRVGRFPWSGPSTDTLVIRCPPASTSGSDNVLVSEFNTLAATDNMEVRAGIEQKSDYAKVNDSTSSNNGLQVATANVPIIAKGFATHPSIGTVTTYVEQDMQLTLLPLFQFGMFYNMDLELYPSGDMTLTGPVHTNNSLLAHPDAGSSATIQFADRVTAADYIYAYQGTKCDTRGGDGSIRTPGDPTLGVVQFTDALALTSHPSQKSNGTAAYNGLATNKWADCRWGDTTRNLTTALPSSSQLTSFRDWATNTYHGYLAAGIHGVTKLVLPGIGGYKEANDPSTPEDDRNNGRQIIESPDHKRYNGVSFATSTDTSDLKKIKISWRAGLYIMTNPTGTARTGKLPNGTTVTILPRSYRCWLNTPSGSTPTCSEVVLPGQPSYGLNVGPDGTGGTADDSMYPNYLPNRLTMGTSVGSNQVLRTIQQPYGTGSGYTVTGAANATVLTVAAGSGTILAGDIVTIGNYNYLVTQDLSGTTLNIASPGLIAAASSAALTVVAPSNFNGTTNGNYVLASAHSTGATTISLTQPGTGSGIFMPGSTITIGSYKYLLTVAPTVAPNTATYYRLYIAAPGIIGTGPASGASVTVDTNLTRTLGTATNYQLNGAHAANATSLTINNGIGSLLPGNILYIGSNRYTVTSMASSVTSLTALTSVNITPGLIAAEATGNPVIVDSLNYSGYPTCGNGGNGSAYPSDSSTTPWAAEAYFYDIRRANNNARNTTATDSTTFARSTGTGAYTPRPIVKIDLDMARFNMMFTRSASGLTTHSGYTLTLPGGTGTGWSNSIYNGNTTTPPTRTNLGLGIYEAATSSYSHATNSFPDTGANKTRLNPFGIYKVPTNTTEQGYVITDPTQLLVSSSALGLAWYDGIAVYIHSLDAEVRAQAVTNVNDRMDSGVRLINGRGPVASYAASDLSGCTICTNDVVYIIGHYNANGTINTNQASTGYGGYSSAYADDSSEKLCSVFGDSITVLSQPTYTQAGSSPNFTYYQSAGWNDAYSALPHAASSSGWNTAASGGTDGVYNATAIYPGTYPNVNKPGTLGTTKSIKFDAVDTEISTALVIGIVPSNHNASGLSDRPPYSGSNNINSGGANNFPRFLETWGDANPLYIRGSMVCLFESRIAMEPFTHSRCYNRPVRKWGLHNDFSQANHHVPLEPIVYSADRMGFRKLTAQQYADRKAMIEGWTLITP